MRGVEQIPWLYDLGLAIAEWRGLGRWRAWLARGATGRVLDLGSGTGRNLPLLPPGARAVAIDPHADALARARRRGPRVPLVVARAEALPFRAGTFDTVVAGLVLCSVDDPDAALAEVRRVLAPGGALRLLEHVRGRGLVGRLQDLVQPAWTAFTGGCHPNRETERSVKRAGFAVDAATRRARGTLRRLEARAPAAVKPLRHRKPSGG
ncbi:MAG TPA: class I SAM-dependent methyltransferase [Anaeromyxobacter sp.]